MRVRPYHPGDAVTLAGIFARAVRETASRVYAPLEIEAWLSDQPDAVDIHAKCSDGRWVRVAVDDDDAPAGWIDLEPHGHIDMLFVSPDWAGRGVASLLYRGLEGEARHRQIPELAVEASESARPVFHHWGFKSLRRHDFEIGGLPIHNYAMTKALPA